MLHHVEYEREYCKLFKELLLNLPAFGTDPFLRATDMPFDGVLF
jgi:hypothetical protein